MTPPGRSGTALSDRYELSDQLGAGGMAEVWLGRDRVLGRTVAVKTLLAQYAGDPHFIERFRREAQNAASLNHPNVVGVYDTGSDNGTHYIVMEYVKGKTLRDVIREEGPLLPERVAEIGADVCAALSFAHQHGIVHRDIKPANIMITSTGSVKVADFGIARAVTGDTVTQTAMVLGTAQYFSPEQAQALPVDARSDLYSLGVVIYEMLTRQVPFTGSSPVAIAYQHVKERPMLPSQLNPDVPTALEAIVMKALAKNPDNRYQTADEMREDLLRALHGRPVEAPMVLSDATGVVDLSSDETIIVERGAVSTRPIKHPPTREEKRRRTGVLLLALIILAILGTAVWAVLGLVGGPQMGTVPDVLGQPMSQAQARLRNAGFRVDILDGVYSERYPEGSVAIQNPQPGERIDKRSIAVKLAPSLGQELIKVPDVTNQRQREAESALKEAGFAVGEVSRENSSTVRAGRVIRTTPTGGSFAVKGSKVNLVVSEGPETAEVPSVVGFSEADARRRLEVEGFRVQVSYEQQGDECQAEVGTVCRQTPGPGQRVERGSSVHIVVATEPPEPSPSPTPTMQTPQCSDGVDNDLDGKIDAEDSGCETPEDDSEFPPNG